MFWLVVHVLELNCCRQLAVSAAHGGGADILVTIDALFYGLQQLAEVAVRRNHVFFSIARVFLRLVCRNALLVLSAFLG